MVMMVLDSLATTLGTRQAFRFGKPARRNRMVDSRTGGNLGTVRRFVFLGRSLASLPAGFCGRKLFVDGNDLRPVLGIRPIACLVPFATMGLKLCRGAMLTRHFPCHFRALGSKPVSLDPFVDALLTDRLSPVHRFSPTRRVQREYVERLGLLTLVARFGFHTCHTTQSCIMMQYFRAALQAIEAGKMLSGKDGE